MRSQRSTASRRRARASARVKCGANRVAPGVDAVGERFDLEAVREYQREPLAIGLTALLRLENRLRHDTGHVRFHWKIGATK